MIHHLEIFPISAGTAHSLKELDKRPDTLIAVNPKTRLPPMCPSKKYLGHLSQKRHVSTSTSWEEGR